jgi:hypothetical protein
LQAIIGGEVSYIAMPKATWEKKNEK